MEHLLSVGFPKSGDWRVHSLHLVLKLFVSYLLGQVIGEVHSQIAVSHSDIAESELKVDVSVVDHDKVFESLPDCVESVSHNIDSHLASLGDWNWVGVDGAEPFLVDRVLAASWSNLLLVVVADQVLAESRVNDEARSALVDVLAKFSVLVDVAIWGDLSL